MNRALWWTVKYKWPNMSANYYKKAKPAPPPNSYGFKQVNARELQDIIKRVTRSTYSAKLYTEEQRQVSELEPNAV